MGRRPSPKHSLDRIDVNGNYEPGNCRWATASEQGRNRSSTVFITAFGKTQCLAAWEIEFGISRSVIRRRMRLGLSAEKALTLPVGSLVQKNPWTKYPWADWLNGDVWELRRGVDFHRSIKSMRQSAIQTGARKELRVTTSIIGEVVRIQAVGPRPGLQRRVVFERAGWKCTYCGCPVSMEGGHVDHVVPKSRGGSDAIENLAAACMRCNIGKGARTPEEWRQ
jgi:hypothetical protein